HRDLHSLPTRRSSDLRRAFEMGYSQFKGRKPFERASKIAHSEILNNPDVLAFVEGCSLPSEPEGNQLEALQRPLPLADAKITSRSEEHTSELQSRENL